MKNHGENKNRKTTFDSHEFINFIADLGPSYIFLIGVWAFEIFAKGGVQFFPIKRERLVK